MDKKKNFRILVVDDEPVIREVITTALREEGYVVEEEASGEEAWEKLQKFSFHVVLTDITMANMSGIDLLFKIKELNPEIEVILITAYASLETAEAAITGKAYRYLRKPFNHIEDVIKIVEEAISSINQKNQEQEVLQELITQRNRLEKKLGQLGTMYSVSHAASFPANSLSLCKEVSQLLFPVLPFEIFACLVDEKSSSEFGGLFIILKRSFSDEVINHLVNVICQDREKPGNIHVEKDYNEALTSNKLEELVEITFPKLSVVEGMLCLVFSESKKFTEEETRLLEVTVAQVAGAVGKLIEFRNQERQRMQFFIEGMVDGVILLNPSGKISLINQAALKILGKREELEEKLKEMGLLEKLDKVQGGDWTLGKKIELSNRKIVSASILPSHNPWEATFTIVIRDITEQQKLQKELERTSRLSLIGELAAGVVHELNAPLTIILGYSQLIMDQPLDPELKNDIKNILDEAQRCKKIVHNLLELAPSKNRQRSVVNMEELIEKVLELHKPILRKAKVKTIFQSTKKNLLVEADSGQIQQVLINLIKNACDAMESQELRELQIRIQYDEKIIAVLVEDTGTGIPEEIMEQIFNPFFTTKPMDKGNGLGLSVSFKIMQEHKGKIWCKNKLNPPGACFAMELPRLIRNNFA